jgi:hypothetical protein
MHPERMVHVSHRTRSATAAASIIARSRGQAALWDCWGGVQFQGRSSSIRRAGWAGSRASTSASQARGSTALSLAVSVSVYSAAARRPSARVRASERPVAAAHRDPAQRPLGGGGVAQVDPPVLKEARERRPALEQEVHHPGHRRLGRQPGPVLPQPPPARRPGWPLRPTWVAGRSSASSTASPGSSDGSSAGSSLDSHASSQSRAGTPSACLRPQACGTRATASGSRVLTARSVLTTTGRFRPTPRSWA